MAGLAEHNFTIVSGLANGIDTIAHRSAIENDIPTIAVLGSGLGQNFKTEFSKEIVIRGGAIVSEYENDMKATLWSFPQRNRIISGLSRTTLIVEAGEKSGSLITARFALDQNREVCAIPGTVYSNNSKGTNKLIKQGAHLVESAEDILEIYGIETNTKKGEEINLSPKEKIIFDAILEPTDIDTIIRACKMPSYETQATIGLMELRGIIKRIGKDYIQNT